MSASFGDNVRIWVTNETEAAGVAGLKGQVYGLTTPSVTGVEVIGAQSADSAINVHIEQHGQAFWFSPELVEFIDHAPGTEINLKGSDKRWIRNEEGGWNKEPASRQKKPWWRFW
jgi:hypothetical protein